MVEHKKHIDFEEMLYERSASSIRVNGILSIIFGGLGVLFGLFFTALMALGAFADTQYGSYDSESNLGGALFVGMVIFILWTLPHVYLVIAGTYLVRRPSPRVAQVLIITNLIVGIFWNLALAIFAIINLTQLSDYERSYQSIKD